MKIKVDVYFNLCNFVSREQNTAAKRSKIDRPLPTDQPIRDRDQNGRLLNEIPIGNISRNEGRQARRAEVSDST